jgi:hypothetical protein
MSPSSWTNVLICCAGITKEMFGWQVASVQAAAAPQPVPAMRRVLSSWFKVVELPTGEAAPHVPGS